MINRIAILLTIVLFLVSTAVRADAPAKKLDAATRQQVISEIVKLLNEFYVYPETAKKMNDQIQKQLQSGAYDSLTDPGDFADKVMAYLVSISHDGHLAFHYAPERAERIRGRQNEDQKVAEAEREKDRESSRHDNFGFRKVERLTGNVGYLDFRYFAPAFQAGDTAIAALSFLANCDAIIIDLRQNGGGDPTQIQLISSFFFAEPTHLNDIYTRSTDSTENFWTFPWVPGKRMDKVDLYILTSKFTFSGAEEFSYNMKNLKRAVLIGETTGGGAHPEESKIVHTDYLLNVPYARAVNPITKTNWEGTGVEPDVKVPSATALDVAYSMAIEKRLAKATDPDSKRELEWVLAGLKVKQNPARVSDATLQSYVGEYDERKVTLENGSLYYQRTGPRYKLIPMSETLFQPEGLDEYRFRFEVENGKVVRIVGITIEGMEDPSPRTR